MIKFFVKYFPYITINNLLLGIDPFDNDVRWKGNKKSFMHA
jgi:hypothetical protein